jgi:2-polyprenyl-3-methyl-5-hydroxy-6-metoxy-1,4-benzoquinol methylase
MEEQMSRLNREGWNRNAYEAWVKGKGAPGQVATLLGHNVQKKLAPFQPYLGEVRGKHIANLLGSNGKMAVSLALLGADVTVVDISAENARYALELARAAGVTIRYVVSDVMQIPEEERPVACDIVVMELGILHWIADIRRFFQLVHGMLKEGGRVIVRDFHPVKRGLLRWENGQMIASGNYFDDNVHEGEVPYATFLSEEERKELSPIATRGWTMGQIVTAMAEADLIIRALQEESGPIQRWVFPPDAPAGIEDRVPGIYTLVADRVNGTI